MEKIVDRIWDKENKYTEGFLKEYDHWVLEVSYRQHTLGSYIIFAKRDIERISELDPDEVASLTTVMEDIEQALLSSDIFKPDRFNYLQMGNGLPHLHFHGIPRYESSRVFAGREWVDESWGKPPIWSYDDQSDDLVAEVRDTILTILT